LNSPDEGGYLVIGAHEQLPENSQFFAPVAGCREIFRKAWGDRVPLTQGGGR